MRLTSTLLVALLLATLGLVALAEEQVAPEAPEPWSLQSVVERTLAASPQLAAARQEVALAKAQLGEAVSYGKPQVKAQLGYIQLDKDPTFKVAGFGTMTFGEADNPFSNVAFELPLYTSGQLENLKKAARHGVEAAGFSYERAVQELAAEAAVAWFQAQTAAQYIQVLESQQTTLEEAVRVAKALYIEGLVAKVDVLRAESELASAQASLTKARSGFGTALANLRRLMALPEEAQISLSAPDSGQLLLPEGELTLSRALELRPELRQLDAYQRAALAQASAARAGLRPQVGVQAQWDFERPTTHPIYGDWTLAVVLSQAILDGGQTKSKAKQAEAQAEQVAANAEALAQGIALQVEKAHLDVVAAEERLQATEQATLAAQEAFRLAEIGYRNQVSSMLEVLMAQTALTNTRVQWAVADFDRNTAKVALLLACGLLPEPLVSPAPAVVTLSSPEEGAGG